MPSDLLVNIHWQGYPLPLFVCLFVSYLLPDLQILTHPLPMLGFGKSRKSIIIKQMKIGHQNNFLVLT